MFECTKSLFSAQYPQYLAIDAEYDPAHLTGAFNEAGMALRTT
jgi:hypothetical protein